MDLRLTSVCWTALAVTLSGCVTSQLAGDGANCAATSSLGVNGGYQASGAGPDTSCSEGLEDMAARGQEPVGGRNGRLGAGSPSGNDSHGRGAGQVQQVSHTPSNLPRELDKTTLPRHIIEPPDILLIEVLDNLRLEDARLQAGDSIILQVGQTVPVDPEEDRVSQIFKVINSAYTIGADGHLDLGPEYGRVKLAGQTLATARETMMAHLKNTLRNPKMYMAHANPRTRQMVSGQHLVRPDGTVKLGVFGSVYVTGITIEEAQHRIEQHLAQHMHHPQVSADVLAYNSKYYYVIADGGGAGEQVIKLPCTGNETVLDAVANVRGLPTVASKSEIWIARPAPAGTGSDQVLPVNWNAIVRGAVTDTNYQVLPGDRLYIKADDLILFDTWVAKITAPWERIFGFTLLGNGTVRALQVGRSAQSGFVGGFGF